ncbi:MULTISPECIES: hypothetical protein [unclassified Marinobacter]|uniref:hypothetical protein n=1 Tax=unclassified Marinobacter TaxID=83889 RepID=UPI0012678842|nr:MULTISPECIES: hypothetical protein [unclassified Marinobacter]
MKLKDELTITERVAEAKAKAAEQAREIDHIELTQAEILKLAGELNFEPFLQGVSTNIIRKVFNNQKVEMNLLDLRVVYNPEE